mgnify:CR=1 FL=1
MRVIVTGATSFIGKAVTKELLAGGQHVFAVVRPGRKPGKRQKKRLGKRQAIRPEKKLEKKPEKKGGALPSFPLP